MGRYSKTARDRQEAWMERIRRAVAVRKNWKDRFRVQLGLDYFEGAQKPEGIPDSEWITINKIYSHVKAQLPSLYAEDPYFYVKLKRSYSPRPEDIARYEQMGKVRQGYLNYLKDEIGLKSELRLAIQDAFFSYGVIKTFYRVDQIENPEAGQPITGADDLPLLDDETMELILQPDYVPINSRYCVERVHPDDFVWDEDAGPSPKSWAWCAQLIRESIEEARKNPLFSRAALKDLGRSDDEGTPDDERRDREERKKGTDIKGKTESGDTPATKTDESKVITYWEVYHIKERRWSAFAESGKAPLMFKEDLPPGVEKNPFSTLRFTLRDNSPYPIPPVSQGLDSQREYNLSRSRIMTHRKRFNRKYVIYPMAMQDESEISKLESGEDGTLIKGNQPGMMPVVPIQDAPLDQWNYQEMGLLNADLIELMGGATDEARGIAGADSATQASILDKRLEVKEGDAMSMVVDLVKEVARKIDQLVQAHIDQNEAVRITGPEGEIWQQIRVEDYEEIEGEYEYDVNVGATIPRQPQTERASWMAFLQLVSSAPQLLLSKALLKEMATQHHIENEVLIDEVYKIGQMMVQAQAAGTAGTPGSIPNVTEAKPETVVGGQAGGPLSLNLPMAGNA